MKKESVGVFTATETCDAEKVMKKGWTIATTLQAIVLPLGQELALKYCGYNAPVKYRLFYKGRDAMAKAFIKVGNQVVIHDEVLYIVHVAAYTKVVDFLVDTTLPLDGGAANG